MWILSPSVRNLRSSKWTVVRNNLELRYFDQWSWSHTHTQERVNKVGWQNCHFCAPTHGAHQTGHVTTEHITCYGLCCCFVQIKRSCDSRRIPLNRQIATRRCVLMRVYDDQHWPLPMEFEVPFTFYIIILFTSYYHNMIDKRLFFLSLFWKRNRNWAIDDREKKYVEIWLTFDLFDPN